MSFVFKSKINKISYSLGTVFFKTAAILGITLTSAMAASVKGDKLFDFVSFEHTTGGLETLTGGNEATANALKAYVQGMCDNDPDFCDLIMRVKERHNLLFKDQPYRIQVGKTARNILGASKTGGSALIMKLATFSGTNETFKKRTFLHEIFHTQGLGHQKSDHKNYIKNGVPGIVKFERANVTGNIFKQAYNNLDDGLSPKNYDFTESSNKYNLTFPQANQGIVN